MTNAAALPEVPGLILVSPDGSLSAMSEVAGHWLRLLSLNDLMPSAVAALIASLRSPAPGPKGLRMRAADVVLHASHLAGAGGAVIVEAAQPVEVADVLCDAYGVSPRERDVVGLVLRGESFREPA